MRESEWKPSNSLAKRKRYELNSCYCDLCIITAIITMYMYAWAKAGNQKTTYLRKKNTWTNMADFNLWCARQTLTQAFHFSGKSVHLSSLPSSKTFIKTTEHSWTKTILSRGGRRKLFNSSLTHWLLELFAKSAFFGHFGDFLAGSRRNYF